MNPAHAQLHDRLVAGRTVLDELTQSRPEPGLVELRRNLDLALEELESGSWGVCEVCHETISSAGMEEHPWVSICFECMSREQREALERDLKSAGEVQRALLPRVDSSHAGWEVEYVWEPFGIVSGDHVDILRPSTAGDPFHLLLGDVAGKGLAASLLQSQLHALFRVLAPAQASLSELLERANRLFFEATSSSRYATVTALRLHSEGKAVLANAGHPRPLIADDRGVRPVEGASLPLGMFGDATFTERELRLRPGDTLFFYTDGLTESWRDGEEYGLGRAAAALRRARRLPLKELLAYCRDDLDGFIGKAARGDDLTMVAVRRTPVN